MHVPFGMVVSAAGVNYSSPASGTIMCFFELVECLSNQAAYHMSQYSKYPNYVFWLLELCCLPESLSECCVFSSFDFVRTF